MAVLSGPWAVRRGGAAQGGSDPWGAAPADPESTVQQCSLPPRARAPRGLTALGAFAVRPAATRAA
eukprot:4542678-Lingulodinium_polyedra.AAC.1